MNSTEKPKAIIFYTYLPPWRIDVFNEMAKYYDLTILFLNANSDGFVYNRKQLLDLLEAKYKFIDNGFKIGTKPFRFGLIKIIRSIQPEVIFSHEYSPASVLLSTLLKLKVFTFKLVITTSDNIQMAKEVKSIKALMRKYILSQSLGIIVYSKEVQDWYIHKFPKLKVSVCPNIQNPESLLKYQNKFEELMYQYRQKFSLNIQDRIILYTGRLVHVKGLDLLINAFSKVSCDNCKLLLIGDGKEKERLEELAENLNMNEKVIFAGYYSGAELYAWYRLAQFFVLPSRYEPFGAVVNEALVYGCPVIASKYIGALDFIKDGDNGLIFDPLNEQNFVDTLDLALKKFELADKKAKNLMVHSFEEYVYVFKEIIENEN
ncbi:glycosyltransferase family 4 protein [Saccharicrinis sp. FJH62]|uniref:glycosyltransferase family 4 protein n=1 Tax=Saccharicrinis sp. FJH62 TaxID=3344657 RepID=UPI0035D418DF